LIARAATGRSDRQGRADEALDLLDDAPGLDGLGEVAVAASVDGLLAILLEGMGGESDDGDGAGCAIGLESASSLPAIDLGMEMSMRMMSGSSERARLTPSSPSRASRTR
jgi:hypothetical protein